MTSPRYATDPLSLLSSPRPTADADIDDGYEADREQLAELDEKWPPDLPGMPRPRGKVPSLRPWTFPTDRGSVEEGPEPAREILEKRGPNTSRPRRRQWEQFAGCFDVHGRPGPLRCNDHVLPKLRRGEIGLYWEAMDLCFRKPDMEFGQHEPFNSALQHYRAVVTLKAHWRVDWKPAVMGTTDAVGYYRYFPLFPSDRSRHERAQSPLGRDIPSDKVHAGTSAGDSGDPMDLDL